MATNSPASPGFSQPGPSGTISPVPQSPADGDRNRGPGIIGMQTSLTVLCAALVLARLYTRSTIVRKVGIDDFLIVVALAAAIITLALNGVMVHYGMGRHQYYLTGPQSTENLILIVKYGYLSQVALILSTMFTRLSICFFLLKIFGSKKAWKYGLYFIVVFAVVTNIASVISIPLECRPAASLWDPRLQGSCWSPSTEISVGDLQGGESMSDSYA